MKHIPLRPMTYDKAIPIVEPFYSNCLKVARHYEKQGATIYKKRIKGQLLPHYYFKFGTVYFDFGTDHRILCPLYFKGQIRLLL